MQKSLLLLLPTNIPPSLQKGSFLYKPFSLASFPSPPLPSCTFPVKYEGNSAGLPHANQEYLVLQHHLLPGTRGIDSDDAMSDLCCGVQLICVRFDSLRLRKCKNSPFNVVSLIHHKAFPSQTQLCLAAAGAAWWDGNCQCPSKEQSRGFGWAWRVRGARAELCQGSSRALPAAGSQKPRAKNSAQYQTHQRC